MCLPFIIETDMVSKVLRILKENPAGLAFQALCRSLKLTQREKPLFRKKLLELEEQGLILRAHRRYFLFPETRIDRGQVVKTNPRFCFVRSDKDAGPDIFIPARHCRGAMLGDTVEVARDTSDSEEKPAGKILRIVRRSRTTLLGSYRLYWGRPYLLPYDAGGGEEIPLTVAEPLAADPGTVLEVDRQTRRVVRILGRPGDVGVDLEVVIRKYELPVEFSDQARSEADACREPEPETLTDREDFREWITMTIDGEDARDFDDAISIRELEGGRMLLGVHIADVSHYVAIGSHIDREAFLRGTSVYFPEKSLPMLPARLTYEVCSLKPGRDRLTFSILMVVEPDGSMGAVRFCPSVIRSAARLTYEAVRRILASQEREKQAYASLVDHLFLMRGTASGLRRRRLASGGLDLSHPEPRLRRDADGSLAEVEAFVPHEAHHLIEEFMLAANEAVAAHLAGQGIPFLYRVHPPPARKDLSELKDLLQHFGFSLPRPDRISARDLQAVLEKARSRPESPLISLQILRSLRLATYAAQNLGHYGLGKAAYTHFTSPIRRYPDLMVHRVLKQHCQGRDSESRSLDAAAQRCSERERRAEEAEKELIEWRLYRHLHTRLGDVVAGMVVEISQAGLLVELENLFVSGIVFYQDLGEDYYIRDSLASVRGRHTGRVIALGHRLWVRIAAVEPELRRLILVPVDPVEEIQG